MSVLQQQSGCSGGRAERWRWPEEVGTILDVESLICQGSQGFREWVWAVHRDGAIGWSIRLVSVGALMAVVTSLFISTIFLFFF